ncbi:MAG: TonB family protein [Oligoflexales bacterium]
MAFELRYQSKGRAEVSVNIDQDRLLIGTLPSNHVVIAGEGVEPIHALLEKRGDEFWILDLGAEKGVLLNGKKIDVEHKTKVGDTFSFGAVTASLEKKVEAPLAVDETQIATPPFLPPPPPMMTPPPVPPAQQKVSAVVPEKTVAKQEEISISKSEGTSVQSSVPEPRKKESEREPLFSPRGAKPSGELLEVVAYWGDVVLEVEHFHPSLRGYDEVTIGNPTVTHFIAAGHDDIDHHLLAQVEDGGYHLNLLPQMEGHLLKSGKVEKVEAGSFQMSRQDLAQIKYGAVKYFFLFVRPPELNLPRSGPSDPLFISLSSIFFMLYALMFGFIYNSDPREKDLLQDDLWAVVQVPETKKPKQEQKKKKKEQKIAEVKKPAPPQKTPPKPKPKPVAPVKPKEAQKKKPAPKKKKIQKNTSATLAQAKTQAVSKPRAAAPSKSKNAPGRNRRIPQVPGGGKIGVGGARKGKQKVSVRGARGAKNKRASGINLGKLGIGVGKVSSAKGAGAIATQFKSSAGGAGGGSGSASKTVGLGGIGKGSSLAVGGSGRAIQQFGSGGGFLGGKGQGGIGKSFGSGRRPTQVNVRAADPAVTAGLTPQEISRVIRAHLNQIRHCYESLLQRSPGASGRLKVRFIISLSGRVSSASVSQASGANMSDSTLQRCVTSKVRQWQFPKPRGGQAVTVNYPFLFSPL